MRYLCGLLLWMMILCCSRVMLYVIRFLRLLGRVLGELFCLFGLLGAIVMCFLGLRVVLELLF